MRAVLSEQCRALPKGKMLNFVRVLKTSHVKEGKKRECGPVLTIFACAYGQLQEIQSDLTDNKSNKLRDNIVWCLST